MTTAFATNYVLWLSAGNMGGRLGWANFSDYIGLRKTYFLLAGIATPLYVGLPYIISSAVESPGVVPLYAFVGSTVILTTILGGTYSTMPSYEA